MKDIFVDSKNSTNKLDVIYLGSFFIIAILLIFVYLIAPSVTSAGLIYSLLAFITILLIAFAFISKNKLFSVVIYGKDTNVRRILMDIFIGASIIILIEVIIPNIVTLLHFSIIPFSISSIQNNNLIEAIILIFAGVEIEEMFLNSTFIPSVISFNRNTKTLSSAILYHFGLILLFFGTYILGFNALIAGGLLFVIGILITPMIIKRKIHRDNSVIIHIFAISLGVLFLSILHVYSYHINSLSTAETALIPLISFFTLEAFINWYRQSTITSRSMHSLMNTIAVISLGIVSLTTGVVIYLIYMIFIAGLAYSHGMASKGTPLLKNRL